MNVWMYGADVCDAWWPAMHGVIVRRVRAGNTPNFFLMAS